MKMSQSHYMAFILFLGGGEGKVGKRAAACKTKQTIYSDRLDARSFCAAAAPHTSLSRRGVILEGKP